MIADLADSPFILVDRRTLDKQFIRGLYIFDTYERKIPENENICSVEMSSDLTRTYI